MRRLRAITLIITIGAVLMMGIALLFVARFWEQRFDIGRYVPPAPHLSVDLTRKELFHVLRSEQIGEFGSLVRTVQDEWQRMEAATGQQLSRIVLFTSGESVGVVAQTRGSMGKAERDRALAGLQKTLGESAVVRIANRTTIALSLGEDIVLSQPGQKANSIPHTIVVTSWDRLQSILPVLPESWRRTLAALGEQAVLPLRISFDHPGGSMLRVRVHDAARNSGEQQSRALEWLTLSRLMLQLDTVLSGPVGDVLSDTSLSALFGLDAWIASVGATYNMSPEKIRTELGTTQLVAFSPQSWVIGTSDHATARTLASDLTASQQARVRLSRLPDGSAYRELVASSTAPQSVIIHGHQAEVWGNETKGRQVWLWGQEQMTFLMNQDRLVDLVVGSGQRNASAWVAFGQNCLGDSTSEDAQIQGAWVNYGATQSENRKKAMIWRKNSDLSSEFYYCVD